MVKLLLDSGASPWSTKKINYADAKNMEGLKLLSSKRKVKILNNSRLMYYKNLKTTINLL